MSRHYMPELGIFLSRDMLPYPNKYRAFGNNPVGQVDKNGLADADEKEPERIDYSLQQYLEIFRKKHPELSKKGLEQAEEEIKRGCIGITCANLGIHTSLVGGRKIPPLNDCYMTLEEAKKRAKELNDKCACEGNGPTGKPARARIIGYRVYLPGSTAADLAMGIHPRRNQDPKESVMAGEKIGQKEGGRWVVPYLGDGKPRLGGTNIPFDFGYYDEEEDRFYHANQGGEGQVIHRSSPARFDEPLAGDILTHTFYCVACEKSEFDIGQGGGAGPGGAAIGPGSSGPPRPLGGKTIPPAGGGKQPVPGGGKVSVQNLPPGQVFKVPK